MTKILYFIQLPPPLHGVSKLNEVVFESPIINSNLEKKLLKIEFSKNLTQLNKFSIMKLVNLLILWIKLFKELLFNKPDYIYFTITPTGGSFYRDVLFVILIKFFGVKPIYHLHGKGIDKKITNSIVKSIYEFVFSNANIIHLSKGLLSSEIKNLRLINSNLFYVENGIELVNNTESKDNKEKIELLFLSNLFPSKGIFIFLDALNILKNKGYDFNANIIGGSAGVEIDNKLEDTIKIYNLQKYINILGPKYGNSKYKYLENADIFVHPTLNDAFPLVLLEAMQFSLPIISTFEGAIPEIVDDGLTGYLVLQNNSIMLAEKIESLINNNELRIKMGRAASEKFLTRYTLEKFEHNMEKIFSNILKGEGIA